MLNPAVDALNQETVLGAAPASPVTVGAGAASLLAANQNRQGLFLEADPGNAAASVIYVLLGTGTPSATNYHIALLPGASVGWGVLGGSQGIWRGPVQVIGSAAGLKLAVAAA